MRFYIRESILVFAAIALVASAAPTNDELNQKDILPSSQESIEVEVPERSSIQQTITGIITNFFGRFSSIFGVPSGPIEEIIPPFSNPAEPTEKDLPVTTTIPETHDRKPTGPSTKPPKPHSLPTEGPISSTYTMTDLTTTNYDIETASSSEVDDEFNFSTVVTDDDDEFETQPPATTKATTESSPTHTTEPEADHKKQSAYPTTSGYSDEIHNQI